MIKKLRKRFILVYMALLISIMSSVMLGLCGLMAVSEKNNSYEIIDKIISDDTLSKIHAFGGDYFQSDNTQSDFSIQRNAIIVRFTKSGDPLTYEYIYNGVLDTEELYNVSKKISSSTPARGSVHFSGSLYRYKKYMSNDRITLIMLDASTESATVGRLLSSLIVVAVPSLVLMFAISVILAKWTTTPVEKAWKKQKEFVADASHELKTPLTVIDANIDVVMNNKDETVESQGRWLDNIKQETSQMSKLVGDLLYIAKSDAERDNFLAARFNFSELVTNSALSFESLAFERGKNFYTNIQNDIYYNGDQAKIKQLVGILFDNALKYSAKNVYVQLKTEAHKVYFIVSNDGDVIPKEDAERVFERFYRGDKSRARTSGGTGLGLAIAKAIVERHKGSIYVDTSSNNLTSFVVAL